MWVWNTPAGSSLTRSISSRRWFSSVRNRAGRAARFASATGYSSEKRLKAFHAIGHPAWCFSSSAGLLPNEVEGNIKISFQGNAISERFSFGPQSIHIMCDGVIGSVAAIFGCQASVALRTRWSKCCRQHSGAGADRAPLRPSQASRRYSVTTYVSRTRLADDWVGLQHLQRFDRLVFAVRQHRRHQQRARPRMAEEIATNEDQGLHGASERRLHRTRPAQHLARERRMGRDKRYS